ncbi:MAG: hypothetical protein RL196_30 [Actinomycetota bacterium]|jgi:hypothetical protein
MKLTHPKILGAIALVALVTGSLAVATPSQASSSRASSSHASLAPVSLSPVAAPHQTTRGYRNVATCAKPKIRGMASCFALRRQTVIGGRAVGFGLSSRAASAQVNGNAGFGATALRKAYGIRALGARSDVIAIVDATHSASAFDDVDEYRKTFGLPPLSDCSSAGSAQFKVPSGKNPCFFQFNQNGQPSRGTVTADSGWAQETALDLEIASAACPKCSLLLVEGFTASFEDLSAAVATAASFAGVRAISNSYGGSDVSGDRYGQYSAAAAQGIAVTASSGDFGFGVESPASFEGVVAVGGTSLVVSPNGAWQNETAWAGSGSGCSKLNPMPSWQFGIDSSCAGKMTADVAAVADPATGVSVYFDGGWYVFGGTSASSPLIAGLYALKNDFGQNAGEFTMMHADKLHDVTAGSNASTAAALKACRFAVWCNAGQGFDGPTGLGTPNSTGAF